MSTSLHARFAEIAVASEEATFQAIPISDRRRDYLAKTASGAPVFLLHDAGRTKYYPGYSFRNLTVEFQSTCRVVADGVSQVGQFCLVSCDPSVPDLFELFISCVCAAVDQLPESSGTEELEASLLDVRELFRAFSAPSGREITGLWGELFVVCASDSCEQAMTCWRGAGTERYDFSSSDLRLEVKSTTQAIRAHAFSLEQLVPPPSGRGYVASLLLQVSVNGLGILDLANQIEGKIAGKPHLRRKLWKNIGLALGSDFEEGLDMRLDVEFAKRHLAVLAMGEVPQPPVPRDPRVSSVKFTADLSGHVAKGQAQELERLRSLFVKPGDGAAS